MKPLLIILLFACGQIKAQQGKSYVLKGNESLIDKCCEKIIGDTVILTDGSGTWVTTSTLPKVKGSRRLKYWIVEYDYGNPPPLNTEVMRWVLNGNIPKRYKEWEILVDTTLNMRGYTEFILGLRFSYICPNHKFLLSKYVDDVLFTENSIEVKQNMDTTNLYLTKPTTP